MTDNDCFEKVNEFEKKYGTIEFFKVASSSLNRLLVKKGVVRKEEIQQFLLDEIEQYKKGTK